MIKKISIYTVLLGLIVGCTSLGLRSNKILNPYKTSKLSNGLNVLYVSDEKLPYISLSVFLKSGYASDPKGLSGLTSATLELLNKGTANKTATQISEEIEQMGAEFDVSVAEDYSTISIEGLAWQEDKVFSILSELLLKPKYDETEIQRHKSKISAMLVQRLDQASYLASDIFQTYYYGEHPYAQRDIGSLDTVKKIDRKAILEQYNKIVRPNESWLVIVGKYSPDINTKVEKYFGTWQAQDLQKIEYPAIPEIKGRQILLVDKADAAQAEIRIGHVGTERNDPDHLATNLANSILGQGFTSRLVDRIRDQLGLTYSINSGMNHKLYGSNFLIRTFTQNARVGQTVSEILKVYETFNKEGVTTKEMQMAKDYMIGVFPSLVETAERTAYNLMILRLFGVSDDYLLNYQKNVSKLTAEEVNKTIRDNFKPDNLKIVIVGKKSEVLPQLKDLGKIEVVDTKMFLK